MSHQLSPEIESRVQAQLATGAYGSEEEVLGDALDALERRQQSLTRWQEMVREADADIAAGRVGTFDRESIKQDVRERLAQHGITD